MNNAATERRLAGSVVLKHRAGSRKEIRDRVKTKPRYKVAIGNRGQVTLPESLRIALGVRPGDKLIFEKDEDGFRVFPIKKSSPFGVYRGIGNSGIPHGRRGINRWLRTLRGE